MKILCFSDIHIRDYSSFPPFNRMEANGFTKELNNILLGADFIANQIKEEKPNAVFMLGDLYHTPDSLSATALNGGIKFLEKIRKVTEGIPFYLIAGNHDIYSEKHNINHLSIFEISSAYSVISEDLVIEVGDYKIAIVTFKSNEGEMIQSLIKADSLNPDLILTHADFMSAKYETGIKSNSTIKAPETLTISGDIHKAQSIKNLHYCGSIVQNRFNCFDLSSVGGVILYDFEKKRVTRAPNTYSKHYIKVEELSKIKPEWSDLAILQVRVPTLTISERATLEGYEWIHLPQFAKQEAEFFELTTEQKKSSPRDLLKHVVETQKPEAIKTFDAVILEGSYV